MNKHAQVLTDAEETPIVAAASFKTEQRYRFHTFYHPYVCAFIHELNRHGVDGMLQRPVQIHPEVFEPRPPGKSTPAAPLDFRADLPAGRREPAIVGKLYPEEIVDFEGRCLRPLQLGAVLPRSAPDRRPAEQEPALRGGAALVPLHLRSDRHAPDGDARSATGAPSRSSCGLARTTSASTSLHPRSCCAAGGDPQPTAQLTDAEKDDLARNSRTPWRSGATTRSSRT